MKYLVVLTVACLAAATAKPVRSGQESNPLQEAALDGPVGDVTKAIVDAVLYRVWKRTYGVEYDCVQLSEAQDEKIPVHILEQAVVEVTKIYIYEVLFPTWGSEYITRHNDIPNAEEELSLHIMEGIVDEIVKKVVDDILDRVLQRNQYGDGEEFEIAASPYEDGIPVDKLENIVADIAKDVVSIFGDFFEAGHSRIALRTNDEDIASRIIF